MNYYSYPYDTKSVWAFTFGERKKTAVELRFSVLIKNDNSVIDIKSYVISIQVYNNIRK